MKKLSKGIIVLAVSGTVIAGSVLAYAHKRGHSFEHRAEWVVAMVSDELELNEPQIAKLNALKEELLKTGEKFHQQHENTHEELLAMLNDSQLDRVKALNIIENKTRLVNQYAPAVVNALGDFYDSLSEEQHAALREHIEEKMQHRGQHREHHRGLFE